MKNRLREIKEIHKIGISLLKVIHKLDRNLLPLLVIESLLSAITPFLTLILSSQMVDELIAEEFMNAGRTAIIMVSIVLMVGVITSIISYFTRVDRNQLQIKLEILIRQKGMELDYATMENPEVTEALRNAESAIQYTGSLGTVAAHYKTILQNIISIVAAVTMAVTFCIQIPQNESGILGILASPVITIAAIGLTWLLGSYFSKEKMVQIKEIDDKIAKEHYKAENGLQYWVNDAVMDSGSSTTSRVNGMGKLIVYNINKFLKQVLPLYQSMGESEEKKNMAQGIENGVFALVAYLFVLIKAVTKAISIGSFMKYAGAFLQLHDACNSIVFTENEISRITKNLVPLTEYLNRSNAMQTGSLHVEKRLDNDYEIEFHDVGFKYQGSKKFSLRHVNAKVTLKNKIAVVGKNGAGKSTFIKLLCRLYDPTEGYITLNGIDIRKYDYNEYLSLFSVVFQDFYLFAASIGENVASKLEFDKERVDNCLKQSGADTFISKLEKGANTVIENGAESGVDLSGGQEQKIAISRALYKDSPFVILDEPTAALDPISEAEIYERFDEMVKDKTSIYISHRMSSCRFCDEIIVFNDGDIIERGSHEDLLRKNGRYSELWNAQAQYYNEKAVASY